MRLNQDSEKYIVQEEDQNEDGGSMMITGVDADHSFQQKRREEDDSQDQ